MNLSDVIEGLVEERGLGRDDVINTVCEGILAAFIKKYPDVVFSASFNKKVGEIEIFAEKKVVSSVDNDYREISLRRAKVINPSVALGDLINVPFEHHIGRIEISMAKQIIAGKIKGLEQTAVYKDFIDKKDTIISGILHKKERAGYAVKMGEIIAFLPNENTIPGELLKMGNPVRVLLKEVLSVARKDYQIILDRASAEFVKKLFEIEIPEVFEGIVEIKKIIRNPGYKTKIIVSSNNKEIDPVGTCVGVGGSRIRPILREIGQEKVDLIEWSDSLEDLVKDSLKPAEVDKVEVFDNNKALVWLDKDQRSLAIGRLGQNISLASRLLDLEIQLQDITNGPLNNKNQSAILDEDSLNLETNTEDDE